MKLKLLALSLLLTLSNLPAEEIREYYFDYPIEKIKSYTAYEEGELGERLVKLNFDKDGTLLNSKTPNFTLTFKNGEISSAEKDGRKMEFSKLFGVNIPTRYVDPATNTDITYTILIPSNSMHCKGILNGLPIDIGNVIEGDMPTKLGSEEINKFYFNSLTEVGEVCFTAEIAKYND